MKNTPESNKIETRLYERNITLYYLLHILFGLVFGWLVVETLYYLSFNLTFFEVGIIVLVTALTQLILEVPSGAYADLHGKKKSLILSAIFLIVGAIFYTLSTGLLTFVIGAGFFGIGMAFWSGAGSALIYESLNQIKRKNDFESVMAYSNFVFVMTGVITNLLVPIIFEKQKTLPFYIGLFFAIFLMITVLIMYEKPITKKKNTHLILENYKQIIKTLKFLKTQKYILWVIFFFGFWGFGIYVFEILINQPLIKQDFSFLQYGVIFSAATIIQSLILYKSKIFLKLSSQNRFKVLVIGWSFLLPLLLIGNVMLTVLLLGILWSVGSFLWIIGESEINKKVKSDNKRATVLSINSMFYSIVTIITIPLFGLLLDFITLKTSILILSLISLIIGIIFLFIKKILIVKI